VTHNIFFVSDHHFGHEKTCTTFKRSDGSPLRPFSNAEEMNEALIERHNKVVKDQDKIYMLGDVVINKKFLHLVTRLKGRKRLIRGNHDTMPLQMYIDVGFEEVYGVRDLSKYGLILSHVPLHPKSIQERWDANVHGHLHANVIDDPRYLNVSLEQTNYTPLSLEEVRERIKKLHEKYHYDPQTKRGKDYGAG
jgi:calcineurin-like phosphoesterase family protein